METFIVLGFCFILYEALDFFQSCYTNNNRHHQQHPQFSKDITSASVKEPTDNNDENTHTFNDVITSMPLSDESKRVKFNSELDFQASSSHFNSELCIDDIVELDECDETNQSPHASIFSICDRVNHFNRPQLIDYRTENTNVTTSNDYDKLIAS